ncbi:MAG: TIGR04282 family arsenosugar biosynthesis glycosyltransferase [Thermoleophilaceae bacterium]|nr:TIGR04282 family arsenosugar biosynthesis glycosyltransferase [Thermoleophilaceae bacterium]
MSAPALIVIAKAPAPGRSKTRLCPPCTPHQAAALAEAALRDTLAAVTATPCSRRVVALEGPVGDWLPAGFDVVAQRGDGLGERLAAAFEDVGGPAVIVAMDTPQVSAAMLTRALAGLSEAGTDAVLGPTSDGGYWTIGLRRPDREVFAGVPMSSPATLAAQRERLRILGLSTTGLPPLIDVDSIDDARAVARQAPATFFAKTLRAMALPASGLARDDGQSVAEAAA